MIIFSPILRHGFAVPPPLPKEANINSKLSAMGSLEKELSVGLRIDFLHKTDCVFSACPQAAEKMIIFYSPILRHGFAVPPPLPKEANFTVSFRRDSPRTAYLYQKTVGINLNRR